MKVLVAGGAGFLGSHLCKSLLSEGHEVVSVDNYFTGQLSNFNDLDTSQEYFKELNHDIIHPIEIDADLIFNLACPASPVHYQYDPVKTIKTSILGTSNLLELARTTGARLLQASTSEVYGDPEQHPQTESYWGRVNPIGIRSCYDEGKRCAETLCFDYARQYEVDIKVVRIFNTYGPNMHPNDGRVVSNFIVQALSGEDITIYGDGSQTRSFCFVDDLIDGMIKMAFSSTDIQGPINLGNPIEFTIGELAHQVIELTGSKSKIVYKDLPLDDPKQRCPDISKAMHELDWQPKIELSQGLISTIAYFEHLDLKGAVITKGLA